jgi:enamine deaminase RidA (YjgF/YER057c/UK114 family)
MGLEEKLRELGYTLPQSKSFGAYVPAKRAGRHVYVSGQLPMSEGKLVATGPVPSACGIETAQQAAKWRVVNGLAALKALEGSLDKVIGVVRVGVFVASDAGFTQQPQIANGASELLVELLGEGGKHVRAAVGTNVLPLNASVEIEFIFEME